MTIEDFIEQKLSQKISYSADILAETSLCTNFALAFKRNKPALRCLDMAVAYAEILKELPPSVLKTEIGEEDPDAENYDTSRRSSRASHRH